MARKPRAQGAPAVEDEAVAGDTPAAARRGRRPKPPTSMPAAQEAAEPAAPLRRRPGPKPRPQETPPTPTPTPPAGAAGKRGRKPRLAKPDTETPIEASHSAESDDGGPALPAVAPDQAGAEKPAAHWDEPTDTVRFDWSAIESTAAQPGPNQVMAKLLIAARAEGANSRWPLQ